MNDKVHYMMGTSFFYSQRSIEEWIIKGSDLHGSEIVRDLAEKLKARMEQKINAVKQISNEVTKAFNNQKPPKQSKNCSKFNFSQVRSLSFKSAVQQNFK